ncbi:hypothetical protein GCM10009799_17620 [Nocardiopsis rhodophaea]|uniref:Uncharacterized protein n=1 Tax=Nocardiopsis rhodophaea TaxID=280238 RepID=A0ABN2STC4_9ACTN
MSVGQMQGARSRHEGPLGRLRVREDPFSPFQPQPGAGLAGQTVAAQWIHILNLCGRSVGVRRSAQDTAAGGRKHAVTPGNENASAPPPSAPPCDTTGLAVAWREGTVLTPRGRLHPPSRSQPATAAALSEITCVTHRHLSDKRGRAEF